MDTLCSQQWVELSKAFTASKNYPAIVAEIVDDVAVDMLTYAVFMACLKFSAVQALFSNNRHQLFAGGKCLVVFYVIFFISLFSWFASSALDCIQVRIIAEGRW